MYLTEKQINRVAIVGSFIIISLVVYALTKGNVSNLSTIGY